ncbi:MAG: 30S ribosomal protein S24e [Thermoprotei archaeon]|nr:MAG: 30S ribosomal protein S24e [Thermoprotei archaeon]
MAESLEELKSLIKIEEIKENPLLNRREVIFQIIHAGKGTPDRWSIRQVIASQLGVSVDCVLVKSLLTRARTHRTKGHAHVYNSPEELSKVEPKHLIIRNLPPEQRAEALKALKESRKGG